MSAAPGPSDGVGSTSGFTVAELLVAVVVSLIVSIAGWSFYRAQLRALSSQWVTLDVNEGARAALDFIAREVRHAGFDPKAMALTTSGAKGISDARSDQLLLQWDANSSGAIDTNATDPNVESVLYSYDSTAQQVVRTVAGTASTLVANVPSGGLSFQYFDANGNALTPSGSPAALTAAQRDAVCVVLIKVNVQSGRGGITAAATLTSRATLRNRVLANL